MNWNESKPVSDEEIAFYMNFKTFEWVDKEKVRQIVWKSRNVSYLASSVIVKEGEIADWNVYLIKSWEVEVLVWSLRVATLKQFDIFWEYWVICEEPRTATVKALTNIECLVVNWNDLLELTDYNTALSDTIMDRFFKDQ